MKKLSRQILLGGAIFFVLAMTSFYTSDVLASDPLTDDEITVVSVKATRLLALLNSKQTSVAVDLGYCDACESEQTQEFKTIAEQTVKYLPVYRVISTTVISGDMLSALKRQSLESDEEAPTARRRLLEEDKSLAELVMAFPESHTPILTFDKLGEFKYARTEIIAPLQNLFPSENLTDLVPAINGWIHNLNDYDLNDAYERKKRAKNKLVELWANSADLLIAKREHDIASLVIEVVEEADKLWKAFEARYEQERHTK